MSPSAEDRPSGRPPGRPRDPQVERAIVDATLALLAESGVAGLSVEAVAARAGVGKATIYRRWPSKDQLVVDAVAALTEAPEDAIRRAGAGSVRDELVGVLERTRRRFDSTLSGRLLPRLIAEGAEHCDLMRSYRDQVIRPRREHMGQVIRRGMDSGELRADVDVEHVMDLLVGPLLFRLLMRPCGDPVPRSFCERVVDDVLMGLRPR